MIWFHENDHGSKNYLFQEKLAFPHIEKCFFVGQMKTLDFESKKCVTKMGLRDMQ
jgi:hypothetical protein